MPVAFRDAGRAIDLGDLAAFGEHRVIGAEPHGAAEIAVRLPLLQLLALHPFGHEADHGLLRRAELRRACPFDASLAGGVDHGHLHAEADAEIRYVANPRVARRPDLAFGAPLAESARHERSEERRV